MNILCIDDNKSITKFLGEALTINGHQFSSTNDGKEGLNLMGQVKFDAILMDIGMPYFSGLDIIDALVKDGSITKNNIIIITGTSMDDFELEKLIKKGVKACLRKPFSIDALLSELEKIQKAK